MSSQTGSRKQITYAHKRNRSKPMAVVSASSPLREIDDPDHYLSHAELSQRLLKRARRSSNPEPFSSKKLKPSGVTPAGSPSAQYETPHPSALTEEQIFKLNSSRGLPVHPDQFSPLPVSRRKISRTASRNLKENASRRSLKKGQLLDSPFNSRPSSAASSPQKSQPVRASPVSTEQSAQKLFKRTLSDTHYNPNIPQSASTTSSPTHAHSAVRTRRPSAPSPLRPGNWIPKETSFNFDFHPALANPFFLPSTTNDIDFNRPPSSLSFYGDSDSQFFDDVQGISTPPTQKRAYTQGSPIADDDDEFQQPDLTVMQDAMDIDMAGGDGMKALPARERSPWLSDSLISAPNSQEWNHPPQEGAYIRSSSQDVDMYDEVPGLELAPDFGAPVPRSRAAEEPASHENAPNAGGRDLKQMFDGLSLGNFFPSFIASSHHISAASKNRFLNSRTRSLGSPAADDEEPARPKGRDRRGTIRASDFKNSVAPARRTRSGTVIGPPAPLQRARSLNGPESSSIGEVDEEEELGGWCADGWVVAAPPSPVVTRRRPAAKKKSNKDRDAGVHSPGDELDTLSKGAGSGLLPSPVLLFKKKGGGSSSKAPAVVAKDVVMEEDEEDELLLRPGFNVWE
jgi:hypothetical protein